MQRVILTRTEEDNARIAPLFREKGVEVISLPMIAIEDIPPDQTILSQFPVDPLILLTSRNGTERWLLLRREEEMIRSLSPTGYLCVGERSRDLIQQNEPGIPVLEIGESGSDLLARLSGRGKALLTQTILYPCSAERREEMVEGLEKLGFEVRALPLYRPVLPKKSIEQFRQIHDLVTPDTTIIFFSPSAVEHFFTLWTDNPSNLHVAAIGQTTAEALRSAGCPLPLTPQAPTLSSLLKIVRNN